jgi:hypothetical protein
MRWVGHVARIGDMRNTYKILVGNQKGRDHMEDLGVDGKIILERIGWEGVDWIHVSQDRDHLPVSCDDANESLGSIKVGQLFEELSDYSLLKKESATGPEPDESIPQLPTLFLITHFSIILQPTPKFF